MKQAKLIAHFLFLSLLLVSTLSRADEAIALLESIRASSDYREFKSKSEIPAPILARAEKFVGTFYDRGVFLANESRLKSRLKWAVTGQNYYVLYLFQGAGVVAYDEFLMYFVPTESQEIIKVAEFSLGGGDIINNYPALLEAVKTNPQRRMTQPVLYNINQFLLNRR